MAERGGLLVNGAAKVERLDDPLRRELEMRSDDFADLVVVDEAGVERVDQHGNRFGHTNRVRELNHAAAGEACGDDVFRDVARHIAGGPIDLGGILARERAAAVRRCATVGIDDDLASGDAGIAVRTADNESAGGVDEEARPAIPHVLGDHALDDPLGDVFAQPLVADVLAVLG